MLDLAGTCAAPVAGADGVYRTLTSWRGTTASASAGPDLRAALLLRRLRGPPPQLPGQPEVIIPAANRVRDATFSVVRGSGYGAPEYPGLGRARRTPCPAVGAEDRDGRADDGRAWIKGMSWVTPWRLPPVTGTCRRIPCPSVIR
jgi:hypothetical protein